MVAGVLAEIRSEPFRLLYVRTEHTKKCMHGSQRIKWVHNEEIIFIPFESSISKII
jgi:hypothetical protein